ncbi:MAG: ABC transporter permease, partial [Bacteroidetes bacterium]|nr:ABC transporter permease [Bacteroidota bacterium]
MFKNYLISAYRNFIRNKFYTLINILGLTIGLAAFIFILLFIRDELTYDRYNKKYERIYRLESSFNIAGKYEKFAIVPIPMGPAFQLEFPEVKTFTRLTNAGNVLIRYDNHEYYEEDFYFADSTVFDVFTYEFLLGEPENALTKPNTMVITEKVARK